MGHSHVSCTVGSVLKRLAAARDDVENKQSINQATKQEDGFHYWPPTVWLAKAHPKYNCGYH